MPLPLASKISLLPRLLIGATLTVGAQAADAAGFDLVRSLRACDVTWHEPGRNSSDSMPLGNGDIGLNVWTEANGDVVFYIGKGDAWTEEPSGNFGLAKLGKIRVSLNPRPYSPGGPIVQTLKLHEGEIEIREGNGPAAARILLWVDAKHPVIHVETKSEQPATIRVELSVWRTAAANKISADVILPDAKNRIAWCHRNGPGAEPAVAGWIFGAMVKGDGFTSVDAKALVSAPGSGHTISIYPLTTRGGSVESWRAQLEQQISSDAQLSAASARHDHERWWDQFWRRSWIVVSGDGDADTTTRGYAWQRFVTACAGRGAYPIKFNGSLFVVDQPAEKVGSPPVTTAVTADFRMWGGRYWFQNTRAMYWPRLMAGDFDEMLPFFRMYRDMLPTNAALVRQYYGHDGAYVAETAPFWGGLKDLTHNGKGYYGDNYHTDLLELTMMGLDYCEYTGDRAFLRDTVRPIADAILTFFDQHFPRDSTGRLVLDPDNALEMYWKVRDPAPDIAGLHAVLARLLTLPDDETTAAERRDWRRIETELPGLPAGIVAGQRVLLPYAQPQAAEAHNFENPELYAIYPFRLYGLGQPGLALARATFAARKIQATGCWAQDPIQAARLGLTELARRDVVANFRRTDPALKFPAFWARGYDYMPDEDNGGNGENALQQMLLQVNGRQILLLPAWPKNWTADFKLNAPLQTVIEGRVADGKLASLTVTPASRQKDVVLASSVAGGSAGD